MLGAGILPAAAASFSFADVEERARQAAASAYTTPSAGAPDFLQAMTFEQWQTIRYRPRDGDLWQGASPLLPRVFLPGFFFGQTAAINVVESGEVRRLHFEPELIVTQDPDLAAKLAAAELGFAGFYLDYPGGSGDAMAESDFPGIIAASYLHFRGRNSRFGPYSRPIILDLAAQTGEQPAFFREFWLCEPAPEGEALTVYALLDAPALTGAYEIVVTPGTTSVLDIRAVLYQRHAAAAPVKIGIAPVVGMYLFSEKDAGDPADFRPEVHTCDGMLIRQSDEAWLWTPLQNPQRLAVAGFDLNNPLGFGLLQRDVDFDHYQDLHRRYERCSSVWVEPKGGWGQGRLELIEIPSAKEFHPNIMAYWVPEAVTPDAADKTADKAKPLLDIAYRLFFMPPGGRLHELGAVKDTRTARSAEDNSVLVVVDFEGEALNALPADTGLTSVVEAPPKAPLLEKNLMKNEATGGWRLTMKFSLPQSGVLQNLLAAREGPPQLAFSAYLKKGENLSEVLTETWRYNYIP
ncbi:MAG: glucan biosynthesis protein [Planctomycetaceae bacterium]|nr:glucan biosynthesis protein [Planctomycetaceae bacterium]